MIELVIPGKPTGKGRPRFSQGRTFTDGKTANAELRVQAAWDEGGQPRLPDDRAIEARVIVAVARPKGHFRTNGLLSAAGERATHPTTRPDLDNVTKLVLDSLNGLAYRDDALVVDLRAQRYWASPGEPEHVRVILRAVA